LFNKIFYESFIAVGDDPVCKTGYKKYWYEEYRNEGQGG